MGTINDWAGTIGGAILGIELIILVLILVAINAGLAFGLWWVLRKMGWVQQKTNQVLALVNKYVDRGAGIAAAPVIGATSIWRGLKAGLYRATHWAPTTQQQPAALPPAPPASAPDRPSRAA